MTRWLRKLWFRLTRRVVRFETEFQDLTASVFRWERWKRGDYYFKTSIRRADWDEWRTVSIAPEQIRDKRGRLVALRVDIGEAIAETDEDIGPFFIDDWSLTDA